MWKGDLCMSEGEFYKLLREKATFAFDVEEWEIDVKLIIDKLKEMKEEFPKKKKMFRTHIGGEYGSDIYEDDYDAEEIDLWYKKCFGE
jgi:hypothetical protein